MVQVSLRRALVEPRGRGFRPRTAGSV